MDENHRKHENFVSKFLAIWKKRGGGLMSNFPATPFRFFVFFHNDKFFIFLFFFLYRGELLRGRKRKRVLFIYFFLNSVCCCCFPPSILPEILVSNFCFSPERIWIYLKCKARFAPSDKTFFFFFFSQIRIMLNSVWMIQSESIDWSLLEIFVFCFSLWIERSVKSAEFGLKPLQVDVHHR